MKKVFLTGLMLFISATCFAQTSSKLTKIAKVNAAEFQTLVTEDKTGELIGGAYIKISVTSKYTNHVDYYTAIIVSSELEPCIEYLEEVMTELDSADSGALFNYEFISGARITIFSEGNKWVMAIKADKIRSNSYNFFTMKKFPDVINALKACKADLDSKLNTTDYGVE